MGRAGAILQSQLVLGRFGSGTCHHPRCVFAVGAGFMGSSFPFWLCRAALLWHLEQLAPHSSWEASKSHMQVKWSWIYRQSLN